MKQKNVKRTRFSRTCLFSIALDAWAFLVTGLPSVCLSPWKTEVSLLALHISSDRRMPESKHMKQKQTVTCQWQWFLCCHDQTHPMAWNTLLSLQNFYWFKVIHDDRREHLWIFGVKHLREAFKHTVIVFPLIYKSIIQFSKPKIMNALDKL